MWILGVLAVISAFAFAWFSILAIKDFIKKDKKKLKTNIIKAVVCMVIFYIGIFAAMAKSGSADVVSTDNVNIWAEETTVATDQTTLIAMVETTEQTLEVTEEHTEDITNTSPDHAVNAQAQTKSGNAAVNQGATKAAANKAAGQAATTKKTTYATKNTVRDLNAREVYIPKDGNKYHYDKNCSNGNYTPVPLYKAKEMGYTPCKKCVK